jgi:pimeloyl-ACP methyl ester carboxylesterase
VYISSKSQVWIKKLRNKEERKMAEVSINDLKFYYEEHGSGEPLVLIAGYTCDVSHWEGILEALASKFHVLIFDNRGAGRSASPDSPYSIEMLAEDCKSLVEALGWKKFHVLGHSMGGAIAQTLAVKAPEKIEKLVLSNTFLSIKPVQATVLQFFLELRKQRVDVATQIRGLLPWIFSNEFCSSKAGIEEVIQNLMNYTYPQSFVGQKRQLEALLAFDSEEWVGNISVPTLVIGGAEDILTPRLDGEKMSKKIPESQLYTFPHIGHDPVHERPDQYVQVVSEFLKN